MFLIVKESQIIMKKTTSIIIFGDNNAVAYI